MAWNIARQALHFHFAQYLFENSALLLHAFGFALEQDGHVNLQHAVHGDALQVNVEQVAFDGLILPIHDHGLGALAAVEGKIENGVMAALGVQNPKHMPRV